MNNESQFVIGKRLEIHYFINGKKYNSVYPIDNKDNRNILSEIIQIITDYNIYDWGIDLSNEFIIDKKNIYSIDMVTNDIINNINNIISIDKALKLTK